MKRLCFLMIILLISTFSVCNADTKSDETSNTEKTSSVLKSEASKDYLTFSVELKKQTYVRDEPVEAKFILTNNSDEKHRLAEPYIFWSVDYSIIQLEGDAPIPQQPVYSIEGPSNDFGWLFQPSESKYLITNLYNIYPISIPPGKYALVAKYKPLKNELKTIDWFDSIIAPPVEFLVTEPTDIKTIQARNIYLYMKKTYKVAYQNKNKFQYMLGMSSRIDGKDDSSKTFRKYAESLEIKAYIIMNEYDIAENMLTEFIKKYGNDDSQSIECIMQFGNSYLIKNIYEEARRFYEKLPEGFIRDYKIGVCNKWISGEYKKTPPVK